LVHPAAAGSEIRLARSNWRSARKPLPNGWLPAVRLAADSSVELIAHRALGWIHWQRGEYAPAEEEFRECLQGGFRTTAEISAWLGTVLALAATAGPARAGAVAACPRRRPTAIRALCPTAFADSTARFSIASTPPTTATRAASINCARAPPRQRSFPPDKFDIESVAAAALRRQDEALTRINPQLAAWVRIRQNLEAPEGDKIFRRHPPQQPRFPS
jgi:hypothetical protein